MSINSVTGPVNLADLGITLPHEHLHMQFDCVLQPIPERIQSSYANGKNGFNLPNLGLLRQYPYSHSYNLKMDDLDTQKIIVDELNQFKNAGGGTIVENTIHGISRNGLLMKRWSEETGVNIIAGTGIFCEGKDGFYVACAQTASTLNYSVEKMHDIMVQELTIGMEETMDSKEKIKCGIIGEIGCSWPLEEFEKNVIKASAAAQQDTNAPVTFHPGRDPKAPFEIMRIFLEAGGRPQNTIMSHLDRTLLKDEDLLEFAKLKTFTQFDLFGTECSYYQIEDSIPMPSDAVRIEKLKLLMNEGCLEQITMSHDIHTKHRLANFGGHGFAHILLNIVPIMKKRGFTDSNINQILVENPKRWLTFQT